MATIDLSNVPATVTITNVSNKVKAVQFYRESTTVSMDPAAVLIIKVTTSEELAHYMQLAGEEITVAHTAIVAG